MNHGKPCKDSYIGAPVRAYANVCQYCGGNGCNHCGKSGSCNSQKNVICEAVVDDAAGVVYLYGNVKHEDYHVPEQNCIAFTGVVSAGFPYNGTVKKVELFEGEQDNNDIVLSHVPVKDSVEVYLNGLRQIEGTERDFQSLSDTRLHFNFYSLIESDVVEVIYKYSVGEGE